MMKLTHHESTKRSNANKVLDYILKNPNMSRPTIANECHLTKATVSKIIDNLLDDNLIIEEKISTTGKGRNPTAITFNRSYKTILVIEAYSIIKYKIYNFLGEVIECSTVTDNVNIDQVGEDIERFKEQYDIDCVSISVFGTVDNDGNIVYIPSLGLNDIKVREEIKDVFDGPVFVNNEANLLALSIRNNYQLDNFTVLSFINGVGLGVIIDGILYKGYDGTACEIGHISINVNGRECDCGGKGCFEQYLCDQIVGKRTLDVDEYTHALSNIISIVDMTFKSERIFIKSKILNDNPNILEKSITNLTSNFSKNINVEILELLQGSSMQGACDVAIEYYLDSYNMQ